MSPVRSALAEEAVSWDKRRKLWRAQIRQEGSNKYLGHLWIPRTQHGHMTPRRLSATRSQ
jgi:hypothetical protein